MLGHFLITFEEALEATLLVAIMLSYFGKTHRHSLSRYVWCGVPFLQREWEKNREKVVWAFLRKMLSATA